MYTVIHANDAGVWGLDGNTVFQPKLTSLVRGYNFLTFLWPHGDTPAGVAVVSIIQNNILSWQAMPNRHKYLNYG